MKLMIKESEDTRIFIDLIRGMNPDDLQEDIIPADEPLKQGKITTTLLIHGRIYLYF